MHTDLCVENTVYYEDTEGLLEIFFFYYNEQFTGDTMLTWG